MTTYAMEQVDGIADTVETIASNPPKTWKATSVQLGLLVSFIAALYTMCVFFITWEIIKLDKFWLVIEDFSRQFSEIPCNATIE